MGFFSVEQARRQAIELGFSDVGIIPAEPSLTLDAYLRWIDADMHGAMGYLARPDRIERRRDLNVILPGVRSLVIVALDYQSLAPPDDVLNDPRRGRFSNYAWGADYHDVMTPRLEALAGRLRDSSGADVQSHVYVDTGAILERSHAQQAGLGFTGKNTMLIHPRRGSFFFLGEILTTLGFDTYDMPGRHSMCGTCTRCLHACPTNAFPRPYTLDARRCISYLTIELKESIPLDLRPLMGNWVYGCDVCQAVCPFTRKFGRSTAEAVFWPADVDRAAPLLSDLLALDDAGFRARYSGSAVERIKRERLVRNACIAAGNSGLVEFAPLLDHLARADESDLVREHARWGLEQVTVTS
ncbi:MAG: tRNA epoxyqueuosine(34) reductase QueG [Chloroflexi bacterium]|nr:MAG: tRNA epoxyqueuosine(34) reductase QueG [Chloroflexota bacterium]